MGRQIATLITDNVSIHLKKNESSEDAWDFFFSWPEHLVHSPSGHLLPLDF